MEGDKLNKPTSRKTSSANGENGKGKDNISDNNGGGEVTLKAKMSLLNGITVIVGSIIGKNFYQDKRSRWKVLKSSLFMIC